MYNAKRQFKNCETGSDSSSSSTMSLMSSRSSKSSLINSSQSVGPKRRSLLLPSCLTRQDSNPPMACPRRAVTPDSCQPPLVRSLESGRQLRLGEEDLELIRDTWQKIPDKLLWCERLFMKLFSVKEPMKKVMGYEGVSPKELMECRRFEAHCTRFVDFWQTLVDTLCRECDNEIDDERKAEKVVGKIREVGYLHCQMPGVMFDAESWLVFKNIILESICWQHSEIIDRRHLCWSKFVSFVIAEMKDAFHQGVRSRSHTF